MDKVDPEAARELYGRRATDISGDNIEFSAARRAARLAMRDGTATPEQRALIEETDIILKEALGMSTGGDK